MAVDIRITVGRRIRTMRRRRELLQADLAEAAGMSRTHLSDIENGRREICLLMIERLAKAFNVHPSELLK